MDNRKLSVLQERSPQALAKIQENKFTRADAEALLKAGEKRARRAAKRLGQDNDRSN